MKNSYLGAVYSENDEVGNSQEFTVGLGKWLADNRDVEFRLNTKVKKIVTKNNRLQAVETDRGRLEPDALVVCMGSWSHQILQPLGIHTNIYPMRGYSMTLPATKKSNLVSITDPGSKMVFTRLGDQIRIAGFADFVGFSTAKDNERTQTMLATAIKIAPEIADYGVDSIHGWGGFRPLTPDSRPLTGPSRISGLHLNTGHGMLGWTLACATGHAVASGI
jgi:D-amino-acid dehydrogenase